MTADAWLTELYFDWLKMDAFSEVSERREYEGVLRELHDIPFYWTIWSDVNRAEDALSYRRHDFLSIQRGLDQLDQHWLNEWTQASPSVLEVMLGISRRWWQYFEGSMPFYFGTLFVNMEFNQFPGRVLPSSAKALLREKVDVWLSRQFKPNGEGSPFPVRHALDVINMTSVDMWTQMNAYSAEHFQ